MSLPAYAAYRDSEIEWLGQVPSSWEVSLLKRWMTVKSGDMLSAGEETDSGFAIVGGNGSRGFTHSKNTEADTLVIGRVGALCGCVHHFRSPFWASEHAYRVVPRREFDNRFFFYLLTALNLNQFAIKTAQPLLNTEIVETQWVAVPPAIDQRTIGAFLDRETAKIDALVEEQRHLIQLLKEKRQSAIANAVTRGVNPRGATRRSGVEWLGDVPSHWAVERIGVLFREAKQSATDTAVILSVSIHDGVSDDELLPENSERKITRIEDRTKYKAVQPGDLVYNMMRAWQGAFGAVKVNGAVSPAYVVARPIRPLMTEFVEWVLRTPQCIEELRRHSAGVTDFRLRLYWDEFKNIRVPVPPVEEQRTILASVTAETSRYQRLIDEAQAAISLLNERRSALISAAVTGKIDVRGQTTTHSTHKPDLRLIVGSAIVGSLAQKPTFGRVKFHKLLFLAEKHAGIDLGGIYTREAAGPLDRDLVADVERRLEGAGRVEICQPEGPGGRVKYRLLKSPADFESEFGHLGDGITLLRRIIELFADADTRFTEAVTTLYAVWNDALIDHRQPTTKDIVNEVLNEWHPEKKEKFRPDELETWLGWMDRHALIPTGKEPGTALGRLFA